MSFTKFYNTRWTIFSLHPCQCVRRRTKCGTHCVFYALFSPFLRSMLMCCSSVHVLNTYHHTIFVGEKGSGFFFVGVVVAKCDLDYAVMGIVHKMLLFVNVCEFNLSSVASSGSQRQWNRYVCLMRKKSFFSANLLFLYLSICVTRKWDFKWHIKLIQNIYLKKDDNSRPKWKVVVWVIFVLFLSFTWFIPFTFSVKQTFYHVHTYKFGCRWVNKSKFSDDKYVTRLFAQTFAEFLNRKIVEYFTCV